MKCVYIVKRCEPNNPDRLIKAFSEQQGAYELLEQLRSELDETSLHFYAIDIVPFSS